VVYRNSRRFIGIPAKRKQFPSIFFRINHDCNGKSDFTGSHGERIELRLRHAPNKQ
jgi:hypothetical protein